MRKREYTIEVMNEQESIMQSSSQAFMSHMQGILSQPPEPNTQNFINGFAERFQKLKQLTHDVQQDLSAFEETQVEDTLKKAVSLTSAPGF